MAVVQLGLVATDNRARVKAVDGHEITAYGRHACEVYAVDTLGVEHSTQQDLIATDIRDF